MTLVTMLRQHRTDFLFKELDNYLHKHPSIADALKKRIEQSEKDRFRTKFKIPSKKPLRQPNSPGAVAKHAGTEGDPGKAPKGE